MLQSIVADLPLGKADEVAVVRDGKTLTLHVTIEEQPRRIRHRFGHRPARVPAAPESVAVDKIGVELADLTDSMADDLGFRRGRAARSSPTSSRAASPPTPGLRGHADQPWTTKGRRTPPARQALETAVLAKRASSCKCNLRRAAPTSSCCVEKAHRSSRQTGTEGETSKSGLAFFCLE